MKRLQEMDGLVLKQPYYLVSFPEARQQYKDFLWKLVRAVPSKLWPPYVEMMEVVGVEVGMPLR